MPRLFCYGTLNVHEIQRALWGEAKEGEYGRLLDYELKLWPNSSIFYVERKPGESVSGKMYELTELQLKRTDAYEGPAYKRVTVKGKTTSDDFEFYVKADQEAEEEPPRVKRPKKAKKAVKAKNKKK